MEMVYRQILWEGREMDSKIMVLDRVEDLLDDGGNVIGRLVTDKGGNELKVKKGQGGKLESRWDELDNGIGKAFEFIMKMFKPPGKTESYPFVADFKEVKDELAIKTAQRVANAMPNGQDTKLRTFALSYAKDIEVAIITQGGSSYPEALLRRADKFYSWLQGGQDVKTETLKESETDDASEILKSESKPEVSWESIRSKLSELIDQKALTADGMLKQLIDLGADKSLNNVKQAFESLDIEGRQKFAEIIKAKKED